MWFNHCNTIDALKRQYYKLCFLHHPDKGGDTETMQAINAEYEQRLHNLSEDQKESADGENQEDIGIQYREQIQKIITLPGIKIEICGTWIWVGGETYHVKTQLKEAGFWFAGQKKMWYWRPIEYKHRNGKTKPIEWIRGRYGSTKVKSEEPQALSME